MDGFTVYKDYLALKLHFSSSYDYKKYNGKINKNITVETFEKKPFRFLFKKLSKKRNYHRFLIAILSSDPYIALDELTSTEAEKRYLEWEKRMQSLSYIFSSEIKKLPDDYSSVMIAHVSSHPLLFKYFLSYDISLETLCILLSISKMKEIWDEKIKDPLWEEVSLRVDKYTPFISYDINKMKVIAYEKFQHPSFREKQ